MGADSLNRAGNILFQLHINEMPRPNYAGVQNRKKSPVKHSTMKKHFYTYTFDTPIIGSEDERAIGYLRVTVKFTLTGAPGEWEYDPGNYDIENMSLVDCDLCDFVIKTQKENIDIMLIIDAIATAIITDYCGNLNDEEQAEIKRYNEDTEDTYRSLYQSER